MPHRSFYIFVFAAALFLNGCAGSAKPLVQTPHRPPKPPPTHQAYGIYHTLKPGETLYRVSKTYNVSVDRLIEVNRIEDVTNIEIGRRIFIPQAVEPRRIEIPLELFTKSQIRQIIGPKKSGSWDTITVHHSATTIGGARTFDKWHRRRRMGGLFYHFVIGNGTHTPMGAVEVGWRWRRQAIAKRPRDIQICLVGNFSQQRVGESQLNSLVHLIQILREQYGIPLKNVRRHLDIRNSRTECPGKTFPFKKLLSRLS